MWQFDGLERLLHMPNNKEPVKLIFNSEDIKQNISKSLFFSGIRLSEVGWTNVKKFVDLFMKMDDLHLSDFREMRLKSKGDFDIAYSAVMGIGLDAYLQKLIVFKPGVWLC